MTTGDYVLTKEALMGGGTIERCNLVCGMTPKRLAEFIGRLELPACSDLYAETGWLLARTAGNRIRDLLEQIERLERCSDPHNPSCECPTGEHEAIDADLLSANDRPANLGELIAMRAFEQKNGIPSIEAK